MEPMPSNPIYHDPDNAISMMLAEFSKNRWLTQVYWPENEQRVRLMIGDIMARCPPSRRVSLLDVGCFNGYLSLVFAGLGYQVTATDASKINEREQRLQRAGIEFFFSNLNDLNPLRNLEDNSFDVVIMGEVIEHVLNHPLGLMRDVARILCSRGLLVMTTPNPATLTNVIRLFSDRWTLWGTCDFIERPKICENQIISKEDIHYREYRTSEVSHLLKSSGFAIEKIRYMGMGVSRNQPAVKRLIKRNPIVKALMSKRLFACTHYFVARKSD